MVGVHPRRLLVYFSPVADGDDQDAFILQCLDDPLVSNPELIGVGKLA